MMKINHEEILRKVAELSDGKFTVKRTREISDYIMPKLVKYIYQNNFLKVKGLGLFKILRRKARKIFDSETGKTYMSKGSVRAYFKLEDELKKIINKFIKD